MTVGTLKEVLNLEVAHMGSGTGDFCEMHITYFVIFNVVSIRLIVNS